MLNICNENKQFLINKVKYDMSKYACCVVGVQDRTWIVRACSKILLNCLASGMDSDTAMLFTQHTFKMMGSTH